LSTRTKILVAVAALAVLVLALSRGGEPSRQLNVLEADPMASYIPRGGTLADTDSRNRGTSLGKDVDATYTRLFRLAESGVSQALPDARAAATDAGWTVTETTERGFLAGRRVPSGTLELAVTLVENPLLLPDGVEPPALSVSLSHLA
jgi:hypothetical protein